MKKRLMLSVIGLLSAFCLMSCNRSSADSDEENRIPVRVADITLGQVVQSLTYSGDIKAEYEVRVFSKIPDRIVKLYVDEGDRVEKGQRLADIYASTIEQAVRQAQAGLEAAQAQAANAKLEYERAERLFRESAMSKQQYDLVKTQYEAANAGLEQAEAALKSARSQFGDASVTAPISGIVGKRYLEEGDMTSPALPLFTIVQMKRVKMSFDATEEDLGRLAQGQIAKVSVKSYPEETFEGKVSKISPILDPMTRMAEVEVLVDNTAQKLKPGMYARVEVITGTLNDVIVVPRYATIENTSLEQQGGEGEVVKNYFVFVIKDSVAQQRKLDVEYANHVSLAVRSGVSTGESLVIQGQHNLRDNIAVTVIEEDNDI